MYGIICIIKVGSRFTPGSLAPRPSDDRVYQGRAYDVGHGSRDAEQGNRLD